MCSNSFIIIFETTEYMLARNKDILGDYDFSRSDKLFILKVPSFKLEDGIAYYEFSLKDLIHN
jgi:hypothetical protein